MTGAAAGLGRGIALALAREGATVAVVDVDVDGAQRTATEATAAGGQGHAFGCDVSDRQAVFNAMEQFVARSGRLDILVNNAVQFHYAPLTEVPEAVIHRMIDVGLKGVFWSTQAATPHLVAGGRGCIVNLSSVAVSFAIGKSAVYTSIKGAIDALTRQQAVELGPQGVRVNAIAPGPVSTPGSNSVIDAAGWEARRSRTPLRRIATVDEVAAAVVFLASDDALSINGITLKIDGGITVAGP